MWGIIGCVMSFAIGLVSERVHGTFVRLQMAPLTRLTILGGKALACFASITLLQVMLFALGAAFFDIRPSSLPLLVMACASAVDRLRRLHDDGRRPRPHRTGGGRRGLGDADADDHVRRRHDAAVRDAAVDADGRQRQPGEVGDPRHRRRVWRNFTLVEMLLPCAILLAFGAVCFGVGVRGLRDA